MRRVIAEFVGTFLLAATVVGSGIMGENLTDNSALILLINAAATGAALYLIITLFIGISGAHFNPVVTLIALATGALNKVNAAKFLVAQFTGGILGTIFTNIIFNHPAIEISSKSRDGADLWLSEILATAGLVLVIYVLVQEKKAKKIPAGVALWIFAGYFFTSSTAIANPAMAIARIFSDSFAGVAAHSALLLIPFQCIGGAIGYLIAQALRKSK
jgi:glycerol uptake facilitator-like aquaporin